MQRATSGARAQSDAEWVISAEWVILAASTYHASHHAQEPAGIRLAQRSDCRTTRSPHLQKRSFFGGGESAYVCPKSVLVK